MTEADYQNALDEIWRKLRPQLEWTEGFALAVLFTSHPAPVEALLRQLQESLNLNTLPLRQFTLNEPGQADEILTAVLSSRPLDGKRPPLWLEMWRDVGSDEQRQAQRRAVWEVLSRLNERRFLLERDVACPLVLVLPAELRMDIPSMAPDLWSVRAVTADLPTPAAVEGRRGVEPAFAPPQQIVSHEPASAEKEWLRLWNATPDKRRLVPEAGFAAIVAALARADNAAAREIVGQVMQAIDQREASPGVLRQRGIALGCMGDVELASGQLYPARAAYAESLELRRRLREATGDTPQVLRDLSVSLNNVGNVDEALNRYEEARAAYTESLELRRRLREATGDTPQVLRDLSVSLDNVGNVDEALNRYEEARAAYAESLELRRRLREAFPDVPRYNDELVAAKQRMAALDQEQHPAPGTAA